VTTKKITKLAINILIHNKGGAADLKKDARKTKIDTQRDVTEKKEQTFLAS